MRLSHRLLLGLITLLSTACVFHPRSSDTLPLPLHTLYLKSSHPYEPLTISLKRYLAALKVHWTQQPDHHLILNISRIDWGETNYPLLYSGNATTYNYSLTVTLSLQTSEHRTIVGPKTLRVSRPLPKNVNQLYTPNAELFMQQALTHHMVVLIYHYLISKDVQDALSRVPKYTRMHPSSPI